MTLVSLILEPMSEYFQDIQPSRKRIDVTIKFYTKSQKEGVRVDYMKPRRVRNQYDDERTNDEEENRFS